MIPLSIASSSSVVERIEKFNQGRNPQRLQLKYRAMQSDIFTFFRGTCHLFYEDFPAGALNEAPAVWICGDLHLENFGSYKGENRLAYFDINDFDEAALAPCTWELARFLTSIVVGVSSLGVSTTQALALCDCAIETYISTLSKGQICAVERETAEGLVKDLLMSLSQRDRKTFLDDRTQKISGLRKLNLNTKKLQPATETERDQVAKFLKDWAAQQPDPGFFKLLDVAQRIAGTGSLGIDRYILLIEGQGSPDRNYLLDLKATGHSSLQPYLRLPQPQWQTEAQRVVTIQNRLRATPPALLAAVEMAGQAYVLRELQPFQDRVKLTKWGGKLRRLERLVQTMASVLAWDQLRSGGRQGSAIADDLIAFAQADSWRKPLIEYVQTYAIQVAADHQAFCDGMAKLRKPRESSEKKC